MSDLRAKITEVLSAHEYAGKTGGPDCGGVCDCPDLCTCGAEVRSWRQHTADAVMDIVEGEIKRQKTAVLQAAADQPGIPDYAHEGLVYALEGEQ